MSTKDNGTIPAPVFPSGKRFFLSLSGGMDSTALFHLLLEWTIPFEAVHFTHGIRDVRSGDAERDHCSSLCQKHNIRLHEIPLDVPRNRQPGEGVEEAARRLRLEAWKTLLTTHPDHCVLTAHHAGDTAETMFLRLCRGGNVSSLTGLRPSSTVEGIHFFRPLLPYTKAELLGYLSGRGITRWITDETNEESIYERNFFRNDILPRIYEKIPRGEKGIAASLQALQEDAAFLEEYAGNLIICNTKKFWSELHPAIRARVVRRFLSGELGYDVIPNREFLHRLTAALQQRAGQRLPIPGVKDRVLFVSATGLSLQGDPVIPPDLCWNWQEEPAICFGKYTFHAEILDSFPGKTALDEAFFAADELPELHITVPHAGEMMSCSGSNARRPVKKLLTDSHIPSEEKQIFPVLRDAKGVILWLPGVRRSAQALCMPEKKVLHITVK